MYYMSSVTPEIFFAMFIFLLIPFVCAYILKQLKLPPVIGYIIGGVVLGNLFPTISASDFVNQFAYFGILLLMFTIGLEINFEKLLVLKRFIVIGGLLQTVFSLLFITIISAFFSFNLAQSILIGVAFSASSTSLVAKLIQERGEESSFLGELALGILMFQDIIFIPFIIIFSFFQKETGSFVDLFQHVSISMIESIVILSVMYYLGKKVVRPLFNKVADSSRELLNVFIVLFIFFIGFISSRLDVPVFIGMFIAGILVSQTSEHYHIFSQIRPIRDVLAIIFFVFIGTHIQLPLLLLSLPKLLLFTGVIMAIKAGIILSVFLYFRFSSRLAFSLAALLFQLSETAFILLTLALGNKLINQEEYLFIISAILISLICTPLVINKKESLYGGIRTFFKNYIPALETFIKTRVDFKPSSIDVLDLKDHIVICGYGRVGSYIGRALMLANIPFIAIDYNFHIVQRAKREGVNIIYGDPTDMDILDFAQVENAVALISVIPDKYSQEAIALSSKKLNPQILIMSRLHNHEFLTRLKDLGVDIVVLPEFEASLSIIKRIFMLKKMPKEDMLHKIRHLKVEHGMT